MTRNPTETTIIDEFEFTAAYGTAVVLVPPRAADHARDDDWRTADLKRLIDRATACSAPASGSRWAVNNF
jgi:hypothetical protein